MQPALFTLYRSSAGSGKTRTLIKEYLVLALRARSDYFGRILTVTFTNKATQEVRDRIIQTLKKLTTGDHKDSLALELADELQLPPNELQERAHELLTAILHNYSQFAVSTIDSFFQKILRSFTREAGLASDYQLEIETTNAFETIIRQLIGSLGAENHLLTKWIGDFVLESMNTGKKGRVARNLFEFMNILTQEEYLEIAGQVGGNLKDEEFYAAFLELRSKRKDLLGQLRSRYMPVIDAMQPHLSNIDFQVNFFKALKKSVADTNLTDAAYKIIEKLEKDQVIKKKVDAKTRAFYEEHLKPLLEDLQHEYEAMIQRYNTLRVLLKNFNQSGLVKELEFRIQQYKQENSVLFLYESPGLLKTIIGDNETPFIYERTGARFNHFLIDEFQDTSNTQWSNFLPLIQNSLASGQRSMIVGDVKQAIYRWRGGDLRILQNELPGQIPEIDYRNLDTNFRSYKSIVDFNNGFFSWLAQNPPEGVTSELPDIYSTVHQHGHITKSGWVDIRIQTDMEEYEALPRVIEELHTHGVDPRDICFLVHTNQEGADVLNFLNNYHQSSAAKPGVNYRVVSGESMRIDQAHSVILLEAALTFLATNDQVALTNVITESLRMKGEPIRHEKLEGENSRMSLLPDEFVRNRYSWQRIPLNELVENLIRVFKLNEARQELAFLVAFQDAVLEFSRFDQSLHHFLEWWAEIRTDRSLPIPEGYEAARLMTIHKAKGLQFPVVILPKCSWSLKGNIDKRIKWFKLDDEEFARLGYLPISLNSAIKESAYEAQYRDEVTRTMIDQLNILYVALTRPVQGLIALCNPKKDTVGELLAKYSKHTGFISQPISFESTSASVPGRFLEKYVTADWREKLTIVQRAGKPDEGRMRGILIHRVLSQITTFDDLEAALRRSLREGYLVPQEADELRHTIEAWRQNEVFASWFASTAHVMTEASILVPGAGVKRPDRIVRSMGEVAVIDFKTGSESRDHEAQVRDYLQVLDQMNLGKVRGYLAYTQTQVIREVSRKPVKRKPDNAPPGQGELFN